MILLKIELAILQQRVALGRGTIQIKTSPQRLLGRNKLQEIIAYFFDFGRWNAS